MVALMKILLVEPSPIVRDRLRNLFGAIPDAILVAETDNEDDAPCNLDEHRPEVAVIDLRLRGGSGFSVTRHVKAAYPDTAVIVLTNLVRSEYRARCMELGADYFFDKSKGTGAFTRLLSDLSANRIAGRC